MRTKRWDAIVIGAGAAGLAAARVLRKRGARVLVVEARDRIGGRVLSVHAPTLDIPIELGPEFIHGLAPRTLALAAEMQLPVVEVPAAHYVAQGKKLSRADRYYDELEEALAVLRGGGADRPVLDRLRALRSPRRRRLALDYVRGFEAADPATASSIAMGASPPTGDQRRQLRLVTGYGPLMRGLARGADVRLGAVVRSLAWRGGAVEIAVDDRWRVETLHARTALVTVPIGVLRAPRSAVGAIHFRGEMAAARRAIDGLEMGQVVRLTLHLDAPIGALLGHPDASFVHTNDPHFPAWWSPVPMQTPLAVAWVGGPPAIPIDDQSRAQLVGRARASLRSLGARAPKVHGAWLHDWRHDPFARGAYAFPRVGAADAGERLARPIDRTLFFAGEATSRDYAGTVEGAIETGERAARSILRALG